MTVPALRRRPALPLTDDAGAPLYDRVIEVLRARHYSPKTVKAYTHWIGRYIRFHDPTH